MTEKKKFDPNEVGELVIAGSKRAWAEKEPVALIGLLMGAITVALFWPVVEMGFTAMQGVDGSDPAATQAFMQKIIGLWPQYLLIILLGNAVMVILARLVTEGRAGVLTGGVPAFVTRLMWMTWRFLGMIGWVLLGVIALWLAGIVIGLVLWALLSLFGAGGDAGSLAGGPTLLLVVIFMIPSLVGILFLYGALGLSLIAESADHHLTVRQAWNLMKGQRIRLAVALVVVYLGVAVINGMLTTFAPKDAGLEAFRLTLSVLHIFVTIAGTFATFIWFSMTAIIAEKIDWPDQGPEQAPDQEPDQGPEQE